MQKGFTVPNPLAYFMQLSKTVKMTIVVGLILIILTFMYFTYQAGLWKEFLLWLLTDSVKEIDIENIR